MLFFITLEEEGLGREDAPPYCNSAVLPPCSTIHAQEDRATALGEGQGGRLKTPINPPRRCQGGSSRTGTCGSFIKQPRTSEQKCERLWIQPQWKMLLFDLAVVSLGERIGLTFNQPYFIINARNASKPSSAFFFRAALVTILRAILRSCATTIWFQTI